MKTRFQKIGVILNIVFNVVIAMLSVAVTLYGVYFFGLGDVISWMGLIENVFYISCLVMIWMYFFGVCITTQQFNYWCSICLGATVLIRDILFPYELAFPYIRLAVLTLSVLLVCMLTYFYARKDWKSYTKRDLWMILVVDILIAALYNIDIYLEPSNEYTDFFLAGIWIRPTITYGIVASFISEREEE